METGRHVPGGCRDIFFPLDLREEERVLDMVLDWLGCIAHTPLVSPKILSNLLSA